MLRIIPTLPAHSFLIDSTLGQRCSSIIGYQFSEIVRSLMSVYFCGGSCVEDVTSHLMRHLSYHPTLRTCSSDTILRAIKELTQENISYTSDQGKTYDFNTADKLNTLLINALVSTGELKEEEGYDVDFDHQFLETEKYDAKPTYKKFLGYRPGVYVIGDKIVYIENSDGNTNVRFHQADTHKRFFSLLDSKNISVNRFRADCGSCSKEIVSEIEKHCKLLYIRANRCSSLYDDIFALRGWKTEEINGIQFELNSILVEKWEGRCYRLVIQRQRRTSGDLDLWEGEYTYRCILTNDYKSSTRDIVEFYNLRGGKERIFDDMNNGFGWNRLPKSFMAENTVFLLLTALIRINDLDWDSVMLKMFTIPDCIMPETRPSDSTFGETDLGGLLPEAVSIAGVLGNSHGALVGQLCLESGTGKTTYGTGSSVMFNVGEQPVKAPNGMVCSVGYSMFDHTFYVLEGHVHSSGAVLDWLRDNLQLVDSEENINEIAESVPNNGGVYFVPAFSGLGSPWWVNDAKAMITGLTMSSTKAHVVRAALESIAYQVADVIELATRDLNTPIRELSIDGESANNDFLMQFQADILGFPVKRLRLEEASGLGSAILNCCACGVYTSVEEIKEIRKTSEICLPSMKPEERIQNQQGWLQSVHTVMLGVKRQ
jgi:hypothetical protein